MNIFISYKGADFDLVQKKIDELKRLSPQVHVSVVRKARHWKGLTKKYIRSADMIVYLVGREYSENIDWEIRTSIRYGHKVYCSKLYDDVELAKELYIKEDFADGKKLKVEDPIDFDALCNIIKGNNLFLTERLFQNNIENENVLIEQYKMLLSTSETLIDRRQKMTNTYVSIFSVLLPIITSIMTFEKSYLCVVTVTICLISLMLCLSWRNSIISYGKSNYAKFTILEEIEKKLPVSMFAAEWIALQKVTTKYKSFTTRETALPVFFCIVYGITAVISIVLFFVLI